MVWTARLRLTDRGQSKPYEETSDRSYREREREMLVNRPGAGPVPRVEVASVQVCKCASVHGPQNSPNHGIQILIQVCEEVLKGLQPMNLRYLVYCLQGSL